MCICILNMKFLSLTLCQGCTDDYANTNADANDDANDDNGQFMIV